MNKFEFIEIIKPDLTLSEKEKNIEKITKYLYNKKCKNLNIEEKKMRELAYSINGYKKGYYIVISGFYKSNDDFVKMSKYLTKHKNTNKKHLEILASLIYKIEC